jgi:peroxiredoxin (alkyl hydroperoxide reductase subunit C)
MMVSLTKRDWSQACRLNAADSRPAFYFNVTLHQEISMSVLVGKQAPDFTVPAVLGNGEIVDSFNLSSAIKGKYGLVFFYPLDFTFVCPSELIALDNRMADFKARNVEVVAVSIDSHFTHNAWRNTPVNNGGIGQVNTPWLPT